MSGCRAAGEELSLNTIQKRLAQHEQPPAMPAATGLRPAAVLILLVCLAQRWHLLYTRRTELVQNHKGQVSFPGGAVEPQDLNREQTALREANEEIGVEADDVEILGCLPEMQTVTGFTITPVVATLRWPVELRLSTAEVSRVFLVPLDWLADPSHHVEAQRSLADGQVHQVLHYHLFDGETIWGATARLTLNLTQAILKKQGG